MFATNPQKLDLLELVDSSIMVTVAMMTMTKADEGAEHSLQETNFFLFRTVLLSGKQFKGSHRTCEEKQINTLI